MNEFTFKIEKILRDEFGRNRDIIFQLSPLLQYLNKKMESSLNSYKSRDNFEDIYIIYLLIEDYINKGFFNYNVGLYYHYEGATYTELVHRVRELPFGEKLKNYTLNNGVNSEFKKYFPNIEILPIINDNLASKYWFNEELLIIDLQDGFKVNIAVSTIKIIKEYMEESTPNYSLEQI